MTPGLTGEAGDLWMPGDKSPASSSSHGGP